MGYGILCSSTGLKLLESGQACLSLGVYGLRCYSNCGFDVLKKVWGRFTGRSLSSSRRGIHHAGIGMLLPRRRMLVRLGMCKRILTGSRSRDNRSRSWDTRRSYHNSGMGSTGRTGMASTVADSRDNIHSNSTLLNACNGHPLAAKLSVSGHRQRRVNYHAESVLLGVCGLRPT